MSGDARLSAVVVAAMPDEAEPFLARADAVGPEKVVAGATMHRLEVAERTILLVRSGIGLVNAASAATAALIEAGHGTPRDLDATPEGATPEGDAEARPVLVNAGSAGGLGPQVRVGDVVVGTRYTYTDADARAFGYERGQVPGMPGTYEGDQELVRAAAVAGVAGELTVWTGLMLSGDSFVDAALVEPVRAAFDGALSTDMESTALAQVAHRFGVPFVSVRGISDLCGPVADEDFLAHVDDAAERSAVVVLEMLNSLTSPVD